MAFVNNELSINVVDLKKIFNTQQSIFNLQKERCRNDY